MVKEQVKANKISPKAALNTLIKDGGANTRTARWLINRINLSKDKDKENLTKKK